MLAGLTLGQIQDACRQIRRWIDRGDDDRAAYWLARLRGEELACSVEGCGAPVGAGERWCSRHAPAFTGLSRSRRKYLLGLAIEAVMRHPDRPAGELAERVGCSEITVRRARRELGLEGHPGMRRAG